jgi:hypothetical protein
MTNRELPIFIERLCMLLSVLVARWPYTLLAGLVLAMAFGALCGL